MARVTTSKNSAWCRLRSERVNPNIQHRIEEFLIGRAQGNPEENGRFWPITTANRWKLSDHGDRWQPAVQLARRSTPKPDARDGRADDDFLIADRVRYVGYPAAGTCLRSHSRPATGLCAVDGG